MKRTPKPKQKISAEEIAKLAEQGRDVSPFFTNRGRMMPPQPSIQRVNVDFTTTMLLELDQEAASLNVSRQAIIKTLVRRALDEQRSLRQATASPARPAPAARTRTTTRPYRRLESTSAK